MRLSLLFWLLLAVWSSGARASAEVKAPRFVSYPDVRGEVVVFTWDGDLWRTTLAGGEAQRLTSHPGRESFARLSPDGAWIAFSASYEGLQSVYVMPATGGTPRRLTWAAPATVRGWSPDGRVLFKMALEEADRPVDRLYLVNLEGHEPEALPLQQALTGAFGSDGRLVFSSKGREEYIWKRYKGGQAQDLWLADLKARKYERLSEDPGRHGSPMWVGNRIFFTSDRHPSGITNLYALDPVTKAVDALTDFRDFDVQMAATDGRSVVFVQGGRLQVLDPATRSVRLLEVRITTDDWKRRPRTVNVSRWVQSAALSREGKALAVEARGEVFLVDGKGGEAPRNLTNTSGIRERLPALSPDGKTLAYVSDERDRYELYLRPSEGGAATRIPTPVKGLFSRLRWSPDGSKLLFGDQTFALFVLDVSTRQVRNVAQSRMLQNDQFTWEQADYSWAPDSSWIAYSFPEENRLARIWLYNLATEQRAPLTNGFAACLNPCFDPDGSRLYYLSHSNDHAVMDPTLDNHILDAPVEVHAVLLQAHPGKSGPVSSKRGDGFRIDLEGLSDRITVLPIKAGNLLHLKCGRGVLGYSRIARWDEPTQEQLYQADGSDRWMLHLFDLKTEKDSNLPDPVGSWSFSPDGSQLLVGRAGALHVGSASEVQASKALPAPLDLSGMTARVVPLEEWTQIWKETGRLYADFFYDAGMHGADWKRIQEKFGAWIPDCPNRSDLNGLLSQMAGELCVGHTYVSGGDMGPANGAPSPALVPLSTGYLGADFAVKDGFYTFGKVYGPTAYARHLKAPLFDQAPLVKAGEYLLAIDGEALKAPEAIHRRLQVAKGKKLRLTVNDKPIREGSRILEVSPVDSEGELRYQAWIAGNIAMVERLSEGQLGYAHLTAMGEQNTGEFDKYWRAFKHRKGLVIDVRGNGGGWTEFCIIDKLERKQVAFNVMRGMVPFRYPGTASDGRYVFLSNEQNSSDGEAFLAHVKARGLGRVVGTRSWGGLVGFINAQSTLDGGSVVQPNNGFYGREGQWWIENEGAVPDVEVENGPDPAWGDRQLRMAVETLVKELREQPTPPFPPVPVYPKR